MADAFGGQANKAIKQRLLEQLVSESRQSVIQTRFRIADFGLQISDCRFRISDFGFKI